MAAALPHPCPRFLLPFFLLLPFLLLLLLLSATLPRLPSPPSLSPLPSQGDNGARRRRPCERRTGADGARQPPPSPPPSTLTVGPYSSLFDLWAFVRLLLLCLCLLTMATSSYMMLVPADSIWWLCCFGPQDVHHFVQGMEEHLQIN